MRMMTAEGLKVLDGSSYERDGIGFAGAKGFIGGFGRGVLTAFGEREIKAFVQASIDETMKLERALSMLRTEKTVIVTHYAPIYETVVGEPLEIWPYLGSSRLAEVIDRHGAALALHGHAHHGKPDGKSTGGVPVHNVALSLMLSTNGGNPTACSRFEDRADTPAKWALSYPARDLRRRPGHDSKAARAPVCSG